MPVPAPTPTTNVEVVPGPNPGETTVTVTTYTDATKSEVESVEIRTGKGDGDAAWDKYSTRVIEQFSAGQVVRIIEVGVTWDRDTPHVGRRTTRVKVVEKYGYPTKVRERETFRIVQLEEGEIKYCFITENWYDGSARRGICFSLPLLPFPVPIGPFEQKYWSKYP